MKEVSADIAVVAQSYRYHNPPEILLKMQDLASQLLRWLSDLFGSLRIKVPGLADSSMASSVMQILLYGAGLVGACFAVYLVWRRLRDLKIQNERARRPVSSTIKLLNASGWQQEAEQLAADGLFREACRALYLSCLQLLHERGIAEFVATRTNYEYWYVLARHSLLQQRFRALVNPVELLWFGSKQATQDDYLICLKALRDFQVEVAAVTPAADEQNRPGIARGKPASITEKD